MPPLGDRGICGIDSFCATGSASERLITVAKRQVYCFGKAFTTPVKSPVRCYRWHRRPVEEKTAELTQILVGHKEKCFVLFDGAAERSAKLIASQRRCREGGVPVVGVECTIPPVFELGPDTVTGLFWIVARVS
jgi:hypothetical protein